MQPALFQKVQAHLKRNLHFLHKGQRAQRPMYALHAQDTAERAAVTSLGRLCCLSNHNRIMANISRDGHVQTSHELLHDGIASGMDDQVCLLALGRVLQVDDDKLPTCSSTAMWYGCAGNFLCEQDASVPRLSVDPLHKV